MPTIVPWLQPPDFIGAARAGAELGLSEAQMHQQAAEHAADLALKRDELSASMSQAASAQRSHQEQQQAALALREEALKQQGLLGQGRLQQESDEASARNELEKAKPIFANTGGGLMQLDPVTKQWNLVPGSVKPDMQTITTRVPPNVTPEKTIPGAHFWSADTVIPAVTNSPGYTISKRVPVGSQPPASADLKRAQSALPDFGGTTNGPMKFKNADEVKAAYKRGDLTYDQAVKQLQENFNLQ